MMNSTNAKALLSATSLVFACFTGACTSGTQTEAQSVGSGRCNAQAHARGWRSLAGCQEVAGDVRIEGTDSTELIELRGVRAIHGTLFIGGNTELSSLSGLEDLRSAQEVVIVNNPNLKDIDGLSGLEQVERVSVAHNPGLRVISGMDKVSHLKTLMIMHNGLTRMSGFNGLVSADSVTIAENPKLIYMTGLKELAFVESLELDTNPRLAPTPGMFPSLTHVATNFSVTGCPGLSEGDVFSGTMPLETASSSSGATASR